MNSQAQQALDKANQHRLERVRLRRLVRAKSQPHDARILLAELVIRGKPEIATLGVFDLLRWSPWMDHRDALELITRIGATPFVTVGHLTVRQRIELARLLANFNRLIASRRETA